MKKLLLPLIFLCCVVGLKAQSNTRATIQCTQIGNYQWCKSPKDSVDISVLPFMRDDQYILQPTGGDRYTIIQAKEGILPNEAPATEKKTK